MAMISFSLQKMLQRDESWVFHFNALNKHKEERDASNATRKRGIPVFLFSNFAADLDVDIDLNLNLDLDIDINLD